MSRCQYGNCDSEAQVRMAIVAAAIKGAMLSPEFIEEHTTRDYCVFHYDEQMTRCDDDPTDDAVGDGL